MVSSPIALRWLPELPDPAAAFHALRDIADPRARLERIAAIAQHQLDFVQTGKLDRQLERTLAELRDLSGPPDFQPVRLAWLGSSTLEHLLPSARIACLRRRLLLHSYLAPYGQYRQELLDPGWRGSSRRSPCSASTTSTAPSIRGSARRASRWSPPSASASTSSAGCGGSRATSSAAP